ncbi:MAG: 30S ribosomal protein S17, partial [Chloroflexi bacterium]|nr:30S ribosomal protein S17 [Chloroflexota bacterium]
MSRRQFVGKVISDKMEKTLVVSVLWVHHHPVYRKMIRRTTKLYVHDPKGLGRLGDTVRVTEARPFSRLKRFLLTEVVRRQEVVEAPQEEAV